MLVLTRKAGEEIVIDKDITIKVISMSGGHVRLGFTAPPEVIIHRKEIEDRIEKEAQGGN